MIFCEPAVLKLTLPFLFVPNPIIKPISYSPSLLSLSSLHRLRKFLILHLRLQHSNTMSARGRASRHYHEPPPPRRPYPRGPSPPPHPHPYALQEELDILHSDLHKMALDRRAILEDRAALERDLDAGKEELHRLKLLMAQIGSEKETYIAQLVMKARRLEVDLREMRLLREELMALPGEIERVTVGRKEMAGKLESLTKDVARARAENEQMSVLTKELDGATKELMHVRSMVEEEKKANMEIEDQRDSVEKSMVSMAREIDQLRVELANTEARQWGQPGGGPYRRNHSSPDPFLPPYRGTYNVTPGVAERGPMFAEYDRHSNRGR
ncbi:DNA double-strand break repair protein [Rhynchospora pubera]|uniref:DNA double-strand break repair protein n=2 Tax=Rhynchospora pubera TaxID=906938 RepID=A0AAV8DY96_9POAL|nr:DNA double-strand break repair protein [Rhynchospora pubera]